MKTKIARKLAFALFLIITGTGASAQNQAKPTVAVLGIDSKSIIHDAETVNYMVRLEMEKANVYNVMDKYDVIDAVKKNNIDVKTCFGKSCVVAAGKTLNVDKMVTGSVERFGEKIVISLKVMDVKTEAVEKQDATEFLNLQPELQKMIEISVRKIMGLAPDPNMVNLLVNYEAPIESPKTQVRLNGPRMGAGMAIGHAAKILEAPEKEGGYNMYPVMFQFGWQHEWQYLSASDFQALIEGIGLISGMESGKFIPSVTFLNGFRFGKGGWEFAFGPSFRIVNKADGFWGIGDSITVKDKWYGLKQYPNSYNYDVVKGLDSRGKATLSASLVLAVGRTFKSGYLNIPVNVYVSPRKEGWQFGASFGFNIPKKQRVQ